MTLKEKRKLCGLTQSDLARLASINYSRLTFAETKRTRLRPDEIGRIRTVLSERAKQIIATV
jgi:transcriptional regulator with XRE-family HTH domain